jgi:hypothetical protein
MHDGGNRTARLLAKLLREILEGQEHAMVADVVADLKTRAGQIRVRWTNADLEAALRMVESNRELLPVSRPKSRPVLPALEIVPRDTARELLGALYRRNPDAKTPWGTR